MEFLETDERRNVFNWRRDLSTAYFQPYCVFLNRQVPSHLVRPFCDSYSSYFVSINNGNFISSTDIRRKHGKVQEFFKQRRSAPKTHDRCHDFFDDIFDFVRFHPAFQFILFSP